MSKNPEKRLKDHNFGRVRSTKSMRPWRIIYSEGYSTIEEARARELYLKSGSGREEREILLKKEKDVYNASMAR